eukprot:COSAG03_NODE_1061_length_4928_cov_1084.029613_8_plen_36_part_00
MPALFRQQVQVKRRLRTTSNAARACSHTRRELVLN